MKKAVVLAGGGSRGAYQIGVWQALRELEWDYQIVTGTSVGALNGALMVQGAYEPAREVWSRISVADVLDVNLPGLDLKKKGHRKQLFNALLREGLGKGGAGLEALAQTVDKHLKEGDFFSSQVDFALMTVKYPTFKPVAVHKKDIPPGLLRDYLLASAACFPAFQAHKLGGEIYIDGGYYDNMPVNLALDLGASEILAVDLRALGKVQKVKENQASITYIRPYAPLGTLVDFEESLAKRNMRLGYLDTLKALGHLEGTGFSFYPGETEKNARELGRGFQAALHMLSESKRTVLSRLSLARIYKLLDLGKSSGRPLDLLPLGAQFAGEFLQLDERHIYTYEEFNRGLWAAYQEGLEKWQQILPAEGKFTPGELRESLALLDRAAITVFMVWLIGQGAEGKIPLWDLQALALGFGKEMAAGLYLYTLLSARG